MSVKSGTLDASTTVVLSKQSSSRNKSRKQGHPSGGSSKISSRIRYQDFLSAGAGKPSGAYPVESFQQLLSKANDWLRKNASVKVKVCETVTWLSRDEERLADSEIMTLSKGNNPASSTYFCRGFRLWLAPGTSRSSDPTVISCKDFWPDKQSDTLQRLIEKVNNKFGHPACKDEIITVQTIMVPILSSSSIDSGITLWSNRGHEESRYTFILRVFYTKQTRERALGSTGCQIGIKDFIPRANNGGYEGFEALMDQTNSWLKDQTDILITNIQSVTVQTKSDNGNLLYFTMKPDDPEDDTEYIRLLRLVYLKPLGTAQDFPPPPAQPLSYQTFAPEILRSKDGVRVEEGGEGHKSGEGGGKGGRGEECRVERMREVFSKASAHLRTSRYEMLCAETVINPVEFYAEDWSRAILEANHVSFLFTIRLYTTKESKEDSDIRRISISSKDKASPNHAAGRGPIFLRSVVTRRYKYGWLAVGLFAVTCMSIIVLLSVVYSNR